MNALPESFEELGLSCTVCQRQREHPWQRQMLIENNCMVIEEEGLTKIRAAKDESQKQSGVAMLETSRKSREEARQGVYYITIFQMVVGQKPIDGPVI